MVAQMNTDNNLLRVKDLVMHFPILRGILQKQVGAVHAVVVVSQPPVGQSCSFIAQQRVTFILMTRI
jgi:hypothetical protein